MKTVKKIVALILLVVGFVACNRTDPPEPKPRVPSYEMLTGGGTIRVLQNETLDEQRQQFHLEFEGTGGSNLWEDFRLTMQHDEWYGSEDDAFIIYNGIFRLDDANGEAVFSGTYAGQGGIDDYGQKEMRQHLTLATVHTTELEVVGETMHLELNEMPDDSYRFLLSGLEFRKLDTPL